jgi:hypothetical protein
LTFRVFLGMVGTLVLIVVGLGVSRDDSGLELWAWFLVAFLASLGAGLLCASLFSSDKNAEKWSDAASSHEVAALLLLVAFPIAWAIRKVFPSDAT